MNLSLYKYPLITTRGLSIIMILGIAILIFVCLFSDVFTVKRRLRNYRREMSHKRLKHGVEEVGLKTTSGRVVLTAIGMYVTLEFNSVLSRIHM